MRIRNLPAALALGIAAFGLSACAESINTTVSRYQAMPAPQGQTFYVVPAGGMASNGGLEFQRYAALVAQQLQARGYTPATNPQTANMVVQFGYGIDRGQVRYYEDPFYYNNRYRYGGLYSPWYSPFYRPRFGWGYGGGYYWGWDDPFWYGGGLGRGSVRTYTVYQSELDLDIVRRVDNAPLFDGRAKARSQTDELGTLVPNLIEAMFTNFPGENGKTVKITVPGRKRA